uniref:CHK kinase-like domain-containing protein n=1 Tax=Plectus sambesii TaxID=2011161 RepID=A0A914V478_9BILA
MPDVLCHGDLTRINMMFDRDTNKLAAIFDWQLIHSGCAAEDIASFIVTSCSMDVRRNQLDHLLETYHSELTKICKGVAPFTLQQLQQAYQLCFKGVMLVTVPAFPYFIEKRAADPEMQASYISHVKSTMEDFADNLDKYHSPSSLTK